MKENEALEPCPFCQTKNFERYGEGWDTIWVHEENQCPLTLFEIHDAGLWNTRKALDKVLKILGE